MTRIRINNIIYTWRVRSKKEREYKLEGGPERKGSKIKEKNTVALRNCTCNPIQKIYTRTDLLGLYRELFFFSKKLDYLYLIVIWIHYNCYPTHYNPVFQLTLYKFIVLDFLGLNSSILWAKDSICDLTIIIIIIIIIRFEEKIAKKIHIELILN